MKTDVLMEDDMMLQIIFLNQKLKWFKAAFVKGLLIICNVCAKIVKSTVLVHLNSQYHDLIM